MPLGDFSWEGVLTPDIVQRASPETGLIFGSALAPTTPIFGAGERREKNL